MLRIGLTGGIGSGKSTVAELFASHGIDIIDADLIAHQITAKNSPALDAIIEHFGNSMVDKEGQLNRRALRDIVFNNTNERRWLEQLLHPLIRNEMKKQIAASRSPYCICVIPLLAESKGIDYIDRALVIDCSIETQIARAKSRDNASDENIQAIIHSQSKQTERLAIADDVIKNEGSLELLKKQVDALHERYLEMANYAG